MPLRTLLLPSASLLLLLLLLRPAAALHCPTPSPSASPTPAPWYMHRYFFYSNDAPLTSALNTVPAFSATVDATLDKLAAAERLILASQRAMFHQPATSRSHARLIPTCNLEDLKWLSAAESMITAIFNRNVSFACVTDYVPAQEHDETAWHHLITHFRAELDRNAALLNRNAAARFPEPDTVYNFPYRTGTQSCLINGIGAFRVHRHWFVNVAITNHSKRKHLKDHLRRYLIELMGANGTHAKMTMSRKLPDHDPGDPHLKRGSTLLAKDAGAASPNFFVRIPPADNVALARALAKSQMHIQQAHDALSPSSCAILFLPLFLNLVPIALLSDVRGLAALGYALLSDVLTTLPLAIKGAELVAVGSAASVGVVARIASSHDGSRQPVAAAEVFLASCAPGAHMRRAGVAFLAAALVAMAVGLALELVARRVAAARRCKHT